MSRAEAEASARVRERLRGIDWRAARESLDEWGHARLGRLLDARQCARLTSLYGSDEAFRKTVSMDAHRFGSGEYRYFGEPLPALVQQLRRELYPPLAKIANAWEAQLGREARFESSLAGFLRRCHQEGQQRPTPLLLRYGAGGWNNLHQDLYGEVAFPLQVVFLLSQPERDFRGR